MRDIPAGWPGTEVPARPSSPRNARPTMPVAFRCTCAKLLQVRDQDAGRQVRCPACGAVLAVPLPALPTGSAVAIADTSGAVGPVFQPPAIPPRVQPAPAPPGEG